MRRCLAAISAVSDARSLLIGRRGHWRIRKTRFMNTRSGRGAVGVGAVIISLGSIAWALAATSMAAVHAAEARALGPGHTAAMPGENELALLAHDARLAAMIVVACGLAVAVAALPRRSALFGWLGGVVAVVVANATLGRVVDGGSVVIAAGGLVVVSCAAVAASVRVVARRDRARDAEVDVDTDGQPFLVVAGVLAAGTLPVLVLQGMGSERYVDWVPADLATANVVTALGLAVGTVAATVLLARRVVGVVLGVVMPVVALVVLVEPSGSSWQVRDGGWVMGVVLVMTSAPLLLGSAGRSGSQRGRAAAATGLIGAGGLLAFAPQLLVPPIIAGGMFGMVLTAPAGAYVNYDGLPVIGGGVLIAAVLFLLHLLMRGGATPSAVSLEVPGAAHQPSR